VINWRNIGVREADRENDITQEGDNDLGVAATGVGSGAEKKSATITCIILHFTM
jgi:hypothetical protein